MTTELPPIEWEVNIPLVTNPMILGARLKAMGATYLLSMLIVGTVFRRHRTGRCPCRCWPAGLHW